MKMTASNGNILHNNCLKESLKCNKPISIHFQDYQRTIIIYFAIIVLLIYFEEGITM